jgi:hypothetical protein
MDGNKIEDTEIPHQPVHIETTKELFEHQILNHKNF